MAQETEILLTGPVAAAVLSAGAGCTVLGILSVLGDASKSIGRLLTFYWPSGQLSGVTTVAILFWLALWFILAKLWRTQTPSMAKVHITALVLLALGVLLTFPPFADLLQGK